MFFGPGCVGMSSREEPGLSEQQLHIPLQRMRVPGARRSGKRRCIKTGRSRFLCGGLDV